MNPRVWDFQKTEKLDMVHGNFHANCLKSPPRGGMIFALAFFVPWFGAS